MLSFILSLPPSSNILLPKPLKICFYPQHEACCVLLPRSLRKESILTCHRSTLEQVLPVIETMLQQGKSVHDTMLNEKGQRLCKLSVRVYGDFPFFPILQIFVDMLLILNWE